MSTTPLPSSVVTPPVVGMVGGGQLARMTHQAGIGLGIELRIMAASPTDSAALVSPNILIGDPNSADDLVAFAAGCDVLTVDHELVHLDALRQIAATGTRVHPPADALAFATDKAHQRRAFGEAGLPLPRHHITTDPDAARDAAAELGWPVVVKTARGGYDGRGVWIVDDEAALDDLLTELDSAAPDTELIIEERLDLDLELAVLVARRVDGTSVHYPVVESVQADGICRETIVPARIDPATADDALRIAHQAADLVGAVGIIAVELFVAGGTITINEVATRPHNSGHWTIEGATTSQFANHLRAVAGLPLGATDLRAPAVVMANVLGHADRRDPLAHLDDALSSPDVAVHLYGKGPRPGRKLGHVTVLADTVDAARAAASRAVEHLGDPVPERP